MKIFNFADFNKNGNKFFKVSYTFDIVNGLQIEVSEKTVSVKTGVAPCSGCDFVSSSESCSSADFWEQTLQTKPSGLFFKGDYGYSLKGYLYCLPENLTLTTANVENDLQCFVNLEIRKMEQATKVLKSLIKIKQK